MTLESRGGFFARAGRRTASLCLVVTLMAIATRAAFAQARTLTANGVSLTFDQRDFERVQVSEDASKHIIAEFQPASLYFHFRNSDDQRSGGSIAIYPLRDRRRDIAAAFPYFSKSTRELAELLQQRPKLPLRDSDGATRELPTITAQYAGQIFISHVEYLDFPWGAGIGWLKQYSQDLGPYAVGSRLNYEVSALDRTNRFAVTAYFNITHPDLAHVKEDEYVTFAKDITDKKYVAYLNRMQRSLDRKPDGSFRPSLALIKRLLESVEFGAADPSDWNSRFKGRKVATVNAAPK